MSKLADSWKRLFAICRSSSAAKHVLLLLAVAGISLAVIWLVSSAGRPRLVYLTSGPLSDAQISEAVGCLSQWGQTYELSDSYILVDPVQKDELLGRMDFLSDGPESQGTTYESVIGGSGIFLSEVERQRRWKLSRETALASQIRGFRGLRGARVFLSSPSRPGLGSNRTQSTATVTVWTDADQPLGPELAQAIRQTVAGSVIGLTPQNVHIIDGSNGVFLPANLGSTDASSQGVQGEDYFFYLPTLRRQAERYAGQWEQKIGEKLSYIPDLVIAVHVDPRSLLENRGTAPPPAGADSAAPEQKGDPDITVSINIPRSYLVGLYGHRHGSDLEPSDSDLEPLASEQITKITATASAIIGRPASGHVQVDWYYDNPPIAAVSIEDAPQSADEKASSAFGRWLSPINLVLGVAVLGLAGAFLVAVRRLSNFRIRERAIALSRLQDKHQYLAQKVSKRLPAEQVAYCGPSGPEFSAFEELAELDDSTLGGLLKRCEPQTVALALRTAPQDLRRKILDSLSYERRQIVHDHPDFMAPVRLSDIEAAQQELVDLLEIPDQSSPELVGAAAESVG